MADAKPIHAWSSVTDKSGRAEDAKISRYVCMTVVPKAEIMLSELSCHVDVVIVMLLGHTSNLRPRNPSPKRNLLSACGEGPSYAMCQVFR